MSVFECRSECVCIYSSRNQYLCPPAKKHKIQPACPHPEPHPHSHPQPQCNLKGNIIKNGGFELWVGPFQPLDWMGSNVLANSCRHTGISSVQLGKATVHCSEDPCFREDNFHCMPTTIFQEVPVCPGIMLGLKFFLALFVTEGMFQDCSLELQNPPLEVRLVWLDREGHELGVGLCMQIPANALGLGWFSYFELSSAAPVNAVRARLSFAKAKGCPVLLDDVSLIVEDR